MINIQELRTGNYVLAINPNYDYPEIKKVSLIQTESASLVAQRKCLKDGEVIEAILDENRPYIWPANPFLAQYIYPLPLSVKLLSSYSGFTKPYGNSDNLVFTHKGNSLILSYDNSLNKFYLTFADKEHEIEYVHQLQNIYEDLIGQELEISGSKIED